MFLDTNEEKIVEFHNLNYNISETESVKFIKFSISNLKEDREYKIRVIYKKVFLTLYIHIDSSSLTLDFANLFRLI